jgi:hypothetical protein
MTHARIPHSPSRHLRLAALAVAVASGLSLQAQVHAQVVDPGDRETATELNTVTVTAQGREEDILAVPYNISAVSGCRS